MVDPPLVIVATNEFDPELNAELEIDFEASPPAMGDPFNVQLTLQPVPVVATVKLVDAVDRAGTRTEGLAGMADVMAQFEATAAVQEQTAVSNPSVIVAVRVLVPWYAAVGVKFAWL